MRIKTAAILEETNCTPALVVIAISKKEPFPSFSKYFFYKYSISSINNFKGTLLRFLKRLQTTSSRMKRSFILCTYSIIIPCFRSLIAHSRRKPVCKYYFP